jgi:transglutaminase-like putative cysteine protease
MLLSLALLLVALRSVALGLAGVVRGLDAGLLLPVAASGVLIGWILARLPLPGWLAVVVASALGVGAVILHVGRLGGTLLALLRTLFNLAWEGWRWPLDGLPDGTSVLLTLAELWAGVGTLLARLRTWSLALAAGEPAFDPLAVALVWGLMLWAVAAWAGWAVRWRDRPLLGVAPAGALLAATLSYMRGQPSALLTLLGATLLLTALVRHDTRERRWQTAGIGLPPDIRLGVTLVALSLSLGLVAAAALAPSVSVRQVTKLVQRLSEGQGSEDTLVASSLGLDARHGPLTVFERVRIAGLPRRHLIGSGPELSRQVVMVIHTDGSKRSGDVPLSPSEALPDQLQPRYYWRGLTYDRYNGRGWLTGPTWTTEYGAGKLVALATTPIYRTVRQEVRVVGDLGELLYVAGTLVTADHDYRVAWRSPGDAFGATIGATAYRADSLVTVVSQAQLRSAGSVYPEWVLDRYLALPDGLPARVLSLAHDLTATALTPYDRTRAIEAYLRTFPYTLDLPVPPPGRDVVDYFLFDLQRGYCDYYATAMVVLARAAGLPARLVTGYARGIYDAENSRYVVTEADAHSWVEVYFPGYGWVEFEPTAGLPAIERPAETIPVVPPEREAALEPASARRVRLGRLWWLGLPAGLTLMALGGVAWSVADGWRMRRLPPAAAVAVLYQRLYRHGRRLTVPVQAGDTPHEFAASLAGRVADLAQGRRWGMVFAPAARELWWLTDLYVRELYSPYLPDAADRAQAIQTWQRLRRRLWLMWMWQKRQKSLCNLRQRVW